MADTINNLAIDDLHVTVDGKEILSGINLKVSKGEIHALMGPNGSGKSTLANAIMDHPKYKIAGGKIFIDGEDISSLKPNERARKGLFLAFQYPTSVPGVSVANFLRTVLKSLGTDQMPMTVFHKILKENMNLLGMDESFIFRYVNDNFSGGEKKRLEILQMSMIKPSYAILDETDSGLDIDALRIVSEGINRLVSPECGILLITHYQRILQLVKPHYVHILINGKIARSGTSKLVELVEMQGYESFLNTGD